MCLGCEFGESSWKRDRKEKKRVGVPSVVYDCVQMWRDGKRCCVARQRTQVESSGVLLLSTVQALPFGDDGKLAGNQPQSD